MTPPAPRIVWILHGDEIYGVKRAILSLMGAVRAAGWQVSALTVHRGETYDALQAQGHDVRSLDLPELPGLHKARGKLGKLSQAARLLARQFSLRRHIFAALRLRPVDAVHVLSVNVLPAAAWAARRAPRLEGPRGIPCFWEMTGVLSGGYGLDLNRRIYRAVVRQFHIHVLANSRYTADSLGNPGGDAQIMYLGVDPSRFDPARIASAASNQAGPAAVTASPSGTPFNPAAIPPESIVFVIAARLEPAKGQSVFLEAMLQTQDPRLHLVLVGGDPESTEAHRIRAIAASFQGQSTGEAGDGGGRRLHFVPFTPEPERFVAMADIVVSSGLIPESFGLSVVEAMMMGKPVLVHALGGPAETVVDGVCGWHVHEPTPEGFCRGIQRALADRPRWAEFGAAARRRAIDCFSIQAQVARYRQIVQDHLAGLHEPASGIAQSPQMRPLGRSEP